MTRRRRRWTWLAAGALVAAAAGAAVWTAPAPASPPYHFWCSGTVPSRLCERPDGPCIESWEIIGRSTRGLGPSDPQIAYVRRRASWFRELLKACRIADDPHFAARTYVRPAAGPGWREGYAILAQRPAAAFVDPALVGEWIETVGTRTYRRELRADGRFVRHDAIDLDWSRAGSFLFLAARHPGGACDTAVLSPDGCEYVTQTGAVGRKVDR